MEQARPYWMSLEVCPTSLAVDISRTSKTSESRGGRLVYDSNHGNEQYIVNWVRLYRIIAAVINYNGVALKFQDLGGNEKFHSMWSSYFPECHAVVFIIDGSNLARIQEAQNCICNVVGQDQLDGVPVLILINKRDLMMELDFVAQIKEIFNPLVSKMGVRECKVLGCSALKGYAEK